MQARQQAIPDAVRILGGKDVLPLLVNAAFTLTMTSQPFKTIGTADLLAQIREEYTAKLGRIPSWLVNEGYGEWLAVNSKRLQKLALQDEMPELAKKFKAFSA